MKLLFKIAKFLVELLIFLFAGFLMLYITYYFGWTLLIWEGHWGNDLPSALNNVYYLERWYPPIPSWVHLWSGGVPFLRLYPPAATLLTFFIHKFSALSVYQVAKLLMLFAFPLSALGVAALGRVLTKNWLVGILAGIIMLLSPDTWLWSTVGGFYALASAVPVFVWSLVFFCLAMQKKNYSLFVLSSFFYGLNWYFHPSAGVLAAITMTILGLGYGVQSYGLKSSWKGLAKALAIIFVGFFLFAWWIFPFSTRQEVGGAGITAKDMYAVSFKELAGLEIPQSKVYITSTFFSASFLILFALGVFVSIFRKGIMRWAALCGLVAIFIMTGPGYVEPVVNVFILIWATTNVRSALILRIVGAVVAAYGAASLTRPFFWLIEKFIKKLKGNKPWRFSTEVIGALVGFLVLGLILRNIIVLPPLGDDVDLKYSGYGPLRNWISVKRIDNKLMTENPETKKFTMPLFKGPDEILKETTGIFSRVAGGNGLFTNQMEAIVKGTNPNEKDRIDISPLEGGIAGALPNFSHVGQIQAYFGTGFIQPMIGWEINCVYYDPLCREKDARNLLQWFGVTSVWKGGAVKGDPLSSKVEQRLGKMNIFEQEKVDIRLPDEPPGTLNVYHLKESIGLASITNKPVILVIGNNPPNNDVYTTVFKVLPRVGLGYDKAWMVEGKRNIDDYSLSELSKFEVLILNGYQYKDAKTTSELLEKYAQAGGKVLVDTGWKYYAKDWGKDIGNGKYADMEMPDFFPVSKTTWGSFGKSWPALSSDLNQDSLADWAELNWQGNDWSMAMAKKEWLKPDAEIILTADNKIIMAGRTVGKGKIVWTGFDFIGHLVDKRSANEERFLSEVIDNLMSGVSVDEEKLDYDRVRPELIKINYNQLSGKNKLMFKEAISDNWGAKLVAGGKEQRLPIYKAGPGWKMVFLPSGQPPGEIVFDYHTNKAEWLGLSTAVMTAVSLLLYKIMKLSGKNWDKVLYDKIKTSVEGRIRKVRTDWKNEEE